MRSSTVQLASHYTEILEGQRLLSWWLSAHTQFYNTSILSCPTKVRGPGVKAVWLALYHAPLLLLVEGLVRENTFCDVTFDQCGCVHGDTSFHHDIVPGLSNFMSEGLAHPQACIFLLA